MRTQSTQIPTHIIVTGDDLTGLIEEFLGITMVAWKES